MLRGPVYVLIVLRCKYNINPTYVSLLGEAFLIRSCATSPNPPPSEIIQCILGINAYKSERTHFLVLFG